MQGDELVTLAGLVGLDADLNMAVLALTTGLTGILGILLDRLADGLLVGNLGSAGNIAGNDTNFVSS